MRRTLVVLRRRVGKRGRRRGRMIRATGVVGVRRLIGASRGEPSAGSQPWRTWAGGAGAHCLVRDETCGAVVGGKSPVR